MGFEVATGAGPQLHHLVAVLESELKPKSRTIWIQQMEAFRRHLGALDLAAASQVLLTAGALQGNALAAD